MGHPKRNQTEGADKEEKSEQCRVCLCLSYGIENETGDEAMAIQNYGNFRIAYTLIEVTTSSNG